MDKELLLAFLHIPSKTFGKVHEWQTSEAYLYYIHTYIYNSTGDCYMLLWGVMGVVLDLWATHKDV